MESLMMCRSLWGPALPVNYTERLCGSSRDAASAALRDLRRRTGPAEIVGVHFGDGGVTVCHVLATKDADGGVSMCPAF